MNQWASLVHEFTAHLERRYGRPEIKSWYFEVWNEPNLSGFFAGKMEDYLALYDASARAVKSVCADYRVGGPATAGNAWVPQLIEHCHSNNVPLDFISTHTYGTHSTLDEFGRKNQFLIPGDDAISSAIRRTHDQLARSSRPSLPLLYTEWSTSPSSRDLVHDSYFSAAFIVNALKRSSGLAQAMSYWTFTDVFDEGGPAPTPFHGGFGLVNLQGLHKPSYYAYEFLHQLGNEELQCNDACATVCRSHNGVQALVRNFTSLNQDGSDYVFFKRDLPAKPLAPAMLTLTNLPGGKYQLEIFGTGYRRNDVYDDYLDLGSPTDLTREQVKMLAENDSGAPMTRETVEIKADEEFQRTLPMRENDVYLVTLKRVW